MYANNAQLTAAIGSPISRADIWALATLTGADMSTDDSVTFSMTHIGQVDCIGADDSGKGRPDPELTGPDLYTHESSLRTFWTTLISTRLRSWRL